MQIASLPGKLSRFFYLLRRECPRLIDNPIILRELLVQLRKKQSFFCLFLFLAVGSLTFIAWWHDYAQSSYYRNPYDMSRQLLISLALLEGITLLIFAPMISAIAINLEKERETWDLLITTPINMASVLLGKFLSSLFFVWMVMISIIPIFSLMLPIGGVSPAELWAIFLVFTEGIIIASLIGLFCSIRWKRTLQAITCTYVFCFLYFFCVPLSSLFWGHEVGFPTLFSPVITMLYFLLSPGELARGFRQGFMGTDRVILCVHYALFVLSFLALVGLCFWQMMPTKIQRTKEFFRREVVAIERWLSNPIVLGFLVIAVWGFIALIQQLFYPTTSEAFWLILFSDLSALFFMTVAVLGVMIFPFVFSTRYRLLWEKQSWEEIASTPRQLRRFIVNCLKDPLAIYLKWLAFLSPFFLTFVLVRTSIAVPSLLMVIFLAEIFIFLSAVVLSCSLTTRSVFLTLCFSYGVFALTVLFLPTVFSVVDASLGRAVSPFYLVFFVKDHWKNPLFAFWQGPKSYFVIHATVMFLYFELFLAFCERRILTMSEKFERESLWRWFRRTLRNQIPQATDKPSDADISFFPDRRNPIRERECRDLTMYRRSSFLKGLIALFLASATISLFLPMIHSDYYRGFIEREGILFPMILTILAIPFLAIPYAANSFRKEHDRDTWTLVATTTLTPLQIVVGKLRAVLWLFHRRLIVIVIPILLLWIGFFLRMKLGFVPSNNPFFFSFSFFAHGLAILYSYSLLTASLATFLSARVSKTVTAYILPLIAAYLVHASPVFFEIARINWNEYQYIAAILSPFFLIVEQNHLKPFWHLCFQTQIAWTLFFSLVFFYLTYHSLRVRMDRE